MAAVLMSGAVFTLTAHTYAADTASAREEITASPVTQKFVLDAGSTQTGQFKVVNTGDIAFDFTVYAKPYSVQGQNYSPNYTDESAARADAYKWVSFDITKGTLNPGDSQDITYTIDVPKGASIGGHYGVLFAETQPKQAEGNQVARKKRVGTILRVNVNGNINEKGSVLRSSIPGFQFSPPLQASLDVKNDGNVDFNVDSNIEVHDVFGNLKYKDKKSNIVYPDTTRHIEQNWQSAAWLGLYKVDLHASYLGNDFKVSHYVLMIPRWLIALVFMLLVGGAYAAYIRRH